MGVSYKKGTASSEKILPLACALESRVFLDVVMLKVT